MNFRHLAAFMAISLPLAACMSSSESTTPSPNPNSGFQARFVPLGGIMPFPNDLYFSGSTDGTLNIPGDTAVAQNGPLLALNHLDGFGTQSDISIYFTQPVDKATLTSTNIIVLKVASSPTTKAVDPTGTITPLVPGTDYSVSLSPGIDAGGSVVTIKPLKPLAASSVNATTHVATPATYEVIVTTGVKDTQGNTVSPSPDFASIINADLPALQTLDVTKINMAANNPLLPVAQFTFPQLLVAHGAGVTPDKVAITFSFSTQYLGISLAELSANATAVTQPTGTGIIDTGETVCQVLVAAKKLANTAACATVPGSTATEVFAGSVALPYYLPVPSTADPTAAITGSWHNAKGGDIAISATDVTSFIPKATVAQNIIPILVTLPLAGGPCTMPGSGWPVVVFQHGITRNREDMLGMASGFGGSCVAVVAIDLPLHGVTDKTDPFYKNQLFAGTPVASILTKPVTERTFDMDLENNGTLASGPDGTLDGSGAWFINLNSTITSRDNLREGAADLINLVATLPNLHPTTLPATSYGFDSSEVFFVGHSLGAIVGADFLGADTAGGTVRIATATLGMPGGHIAELLRNSPTFGPVIDNGLEQQGLVKGSQSYYDFYSEAQAVVEDGDPANYAAAAALGHPIHMIEVVGNGGANKPDQVVPNSATKVLSDQMGLTAVSTTTVDPSGVRGLVQFTAGDHGSLLDPTASAAATTEMQTEMVVFAIGNPTVPLPALGQTLLISDPSVVK